MHPTILAKRKAEAVGKLVFASEALGELLNLDPALIAGLHPVGTHDNLLREMLLLEGAANLIQAVAIHSGAIKEGASTLAPARSAGVETEAAKPEAHWVEAAGPDPEPPQTDQSKELEFLSPETAETTKIDTEAPAEEEPATPRKPKRKSKK